VEKVKDESVWIYKNIENALGEKHQKNNLKRRAK